MVEKTRGAWEVDAGAFRDPKKTSGILYFLCFFLKEPLGYSEDIYGRSPLHGCLQQTTARVATRKSL
jgi:hypothetical protein